MNCFLESRSDDQSANDRNYPASLPQSRARVAIFIRNRIVACQFWRSQIITSSTLVCTPYRYHNITHIFARPGIFCIQLSSNIEIFTATRKLKMNYGVLSLGALITTRNYSGNH